MPYKQEYNATTVKKAKMHTPASVMGSQGTAANIPYGGAKAAPTKATPFPGGMKSKKSK